jgi:hypothetical protein
MIDLIDRKHLEVEPEEEVDTDEKGKVKWKKPSRK